MNVSMNIVNMGQLYYYYHDDDDKAMELYNKAIDMDNNSYAMYCKGSMLHRKSLVKNSNANLNANFSYDTNKEMDICNEYSLIYKYQNRFWKMVALIYIYIYII